MRVDYTIRAHKRSFSIFSFNIYPHRTRSIFQLTHKAANSMNFRGNNPINFHNSSIHGVRTTMRTNIILRCNSNYKDVVLCTLHWRGINYMTMGRLFRLSTNPKSNIFSTFYCPISSSRISTSTSNFSAPERVI